MAQLHPMVVHFPIALILVGIVCDLARATRFKDVPALSTLGLWCTTLGVAMMLPAIGTGLLAHTFQAAPSEQVQTLINYHERLSYLELMLFGVLVAWRWDSRGDDQSIMPIGYLTAAIIGGLLLIVASYLGGMLVYRHGMGLDLEPAGTTPSTAPGQTRDGG